MRQSPDNALGRARYRKIFLIRRNLSGGGGAGGALAARQAFEYRSLISPWPPALDHSIIIHILRNSKTRWNTQVASNGGCVIDGPRGPEAARPQQVMVDDGVVWRCGRWSLCPALVRVRHHEDLARSTYLH